VDTWTGAANNDVINATPDTLTIFDTIDGGAGTDSLNIADTKAALGSALPAGVKITNVEKVNITTTGGVGQVTAAGTAAAAQVNTYKFATTPGAATDTLVVNYGNQASTIVTGATKITAAAALAAAINNAAGKAIATSDGIDSVTVTASTAGTALPAITFGAAVAGDVPTTTFTTANVAASGATTAAVYDLSGVTGLTATAITAAGNVNAKFATTSDATVTTVGAVTTSGGVNVTTKNSGGDVSVTGSTGNVDVTNTAQAANAVAVSGTKNITVTNTSASTGATTVTSTSTATTTNKVVVKSTHTGNGATTITGGNQIELTDTLTGGTGGAISVTGSLGSGSYASVFQTISGSGTTAGGTIGVTGTERILVDVKASQAAAAANTTVGAITATGSVITKSAEAYQTAALTAGTLASMPATKQVDNVTFNALTAGQTVVVAGLTFTAGLAGATAAQVAAAFANLSVGDVVGSSSSTVGTFSGAVTGYTSGPANGNTVSFTNQSAGTASVITVNTGTGTAPVAGAYILGLASLTGASYGGIVNGAVTVSDIYYAAGVGVSKGTITDVKLSNPGAVTINDNALQTLTVSGGTNPLGWSSATATGNITVNSASLLTAADLTTGLTVNATGKLGSLTLASTNYKTLNVNVGEGGTQIAGIAAASVTDLTVSGVGALDDSGSDTYTALKTVTVTGSAGLTNGSSAVDLSGASALTSVNTSASTGTTSVKIDSTKAVYVGGAGVDKVTTGSSIGKGIDLGAGNDTLTLGGTTITANIVGGDGTDTLTMSNADAATVAASASLLSYISGFEAVKLTGTGSATTVDVSKFGVTSVTLDTITTAQAVDNLASGGTLTLGSSSGGGATLTNTKTAASTSTADSLNLNISVKDAAHANGTVTSTASAFETINIVSSDLSDTVANPTTKIGITNIGTLTVTDTAVKAINVSGTGALVLTTTSDAALTSIDASSLSGDFTVIALTSTAAATVKGGSGTDVLAAHGYTVTAGSTIGASTAAYSANTVADTLNGGAGNDTLYANAGANTLTGGAGKDLFVVQNAGATKATFTTITDFGAGDTLKLKATTAAEAFVSTKVAFTTTPVTLSDAINASLVGSGDGAIKWFQYGDATYVVQNVGHASATGFTDGSDIVVKLSGLVDLTNASFSTAADGSSNPTLTLFA
jgi:S-layer protein